MLRSKSTVFCTTFFLAAQRLLASDPAPTQTTSTDGNSYHGPIPVNDPFPDNYYGADHGGSSLTLNYSFTSPFGYTDHSRGQFVYSCSPFTPRGSEGVFGMDVWLEQQNPDGSWSPASQNGGLADNHAQAYQPINTPNPGPSPSYTFTWTFDANRLPAHANFRVFVYVYIYNQGGGSQGDYPIYSSTSAVSTGAANDAPRIGWSPSSGATNPSQVQAGQTYVISADAQDDNGNLATVSIDKNGQPFAYAGGGNGSSGNSQNPTSDSAGTITYAAWAADSYGAQSPTITWTVNVVGKSNQPGVSSSNATLAFGQAFAPPYFGGAGAGGWQFVVGGYTNWNGGTSGNTGTWPPGSGWTPNWTPPGVGSYSFWVVRDGDSNYNTSGVAGPYTLTVLPASAILSASPTIFTYDGSWQGPGISSSPAGVPYATSGTTSAIGAGNYSFTATATGNYTGSNAFSWSINPANQAAVTVSPASTTITAGQSVTFAASGGSGTGSYEWEGAASGAGSSTTVGFPNSGTYTVTVYRAGDGNYLASGLSSATVTVNVPQYTLSTIAVGNGTVTPGGTYPANSILTVTATPASTAYFSGWTGGMTGVANPLPVTMSSNVTLYANFTNRQAQTIIFTPPATGLFPGPPLTLTATASSGLPVALSVISGPGTLTGNQLSLSGPGPIVVQASQAGNTQWLPAAAVVGTINVGVVPPIARIRFNANGCDARVSNGPGSGGSSAIWTDPAGLQQSPWPSIASPPTAPSGSSNVALPATPIAQPSSN